LAQAEGWPCSARKGNIPRVQALESPDDDGEKGKGCPEGSGASVEAGFDAAPVLEAQKKRGWCRSSTRPAAKTGSAASPSGAIDSSIDGAPTNRGGRRRTRQQDCAPTRLGLDSRRALGPATIPAASTGRTHDRTRPMLHQVAKFLPRRRPHVTRSCLSSAERMSSDRGALHSTPYSSIGVLAYPFSDRVSTTT
jgi:hypothetical protein